MWHLYNLIQAGDLVRATTVRYGRRLFLSALYSGCHLYRRIQSVSNTGSVDSNRIRLNLTLQVSRVEFSPGGGSSAQESTHAAASSSQNANASLHISGKVVVENPHVRLGAFHTLDIETNRDVRIEKLHGWDSIAVSRVEESTVPGRGAELAAVICGEGTATFCLLSQHMTVVTHRISISIPRKAATAGASQHEKGIGRFYATLFDSFLRHVPFANDGIRAIVIASPGWIRDGVYDYLLAEAIKRSNKELQKALREKVIRVHINSPYVHSLVEVLKNPEVRFRQNFHAQTCDPLPDHSSIKGN